jgi:hypothetical protein
MSTGYNSLTFQDILLVTSSEFKMGDYGTGKIPKNDSEFLPPDIMQWSRST